jgi:hypothetical protein
MQIGNWSNSVRCEGDANIAWSVQVRSGLFQGFGESESSFLPARRSSKR